MENLITTFCILISFGHAKAQINYNVTELIDAFNKKSNVGHGPTFYWFNPYRMGNMGKFLLCVDVLQKVDRIRLMEGHYVTHNHTTELPNFDWRFWKIEDTQTLYYALHCPLRSVKFEKLQYTNARDFYIIEGGNKFCVYMLKANPNFIRLLIVAEVCGIMVNIRYNQKELDNEIKSTLESSSNELILLGWPGLADMSEKKKFTICMEFCDKNSYFNFFTSYKTISGDDGSSLFKSVNYFKLVFSDGTHMKGEIQTLFCPMDRLNIQLTKNADNLYPVPSFQLVRSINDDCIYKVKIIKNADKNTTNEDYEASVSIQAELCGIFGPKSISSHEIENQFVEKWGAILGQSFTTLPSFELTKLNFHTLVHLCLNVIKKIYEKRRSTLVQRYYVQFGNVQLRLTTNRTRNIQIKTFKCPHVPKTWGPLADLYLLESVNLGCIYALTNNTSGNFEELVIAAELCGVYPIPNLLEVQGIHMYAENHIIGFE